MIKSNPNVTHLSLYDLVAVPGIAADLGHINTNATVSGHLGDVKVAENDKLHEALIGANIVVSSAGIARKPGMVSFTSFY